MRTDRILVDERHAAREAAARKSASLAKAAGAGVSGGVGIPFKDLRAKQCQFEVHGANAWVAPESMLFCAAATDGGPWCPAHMALVYTPAALRPSKFGGGAR